MTYTIISIYYSHSCCGSGKNLETSWLSSYNSESLMKLQSRYWPGVRHLQAWLPRWLIHISSNKFVLAVIRSLRPNYMDLSTGLPECSHDMATGFFHWMIQEKEQGVNFYDFYELASKKHTSPLHFFWTPMDSQASHDSVCEVTRVWIPRGKGHLGYTSTFKFFVASQNQLHKINCVCIFLMKFKLFMGQLKALSACFMI